MELIEAIDRAWMVVNKTAVNAFAYPDKIRLAEGILELVFPYHSDAEELNCIVLGKSFQVVENKPTKLKLSTSGFTNYKGELVDITKLPFVIDSSQKIIAYCQSNNSQTQGLKIVNDPTALKENEIVIYNNNTITVSKNLEDKIITVLAEGWLQRWIEPQSQPLERITFCLLSSTRLQVIAGSLTNLEPNTAFLKTPTRTVAIADLQEISNQEVS